MLVIKTALKVECWVLHNLFSFYGFFTLSLYTTHSTRSTNRVLFSRTLFVLVVPCILISVPVVVWLKKVQIGPKRSKKKFDQCNNEHCSGIRESDLSTTYNI